MSETMAFPKGAYKLLLYFLIHSLCSWMSPLMELGSKDNPYNSPVLCDIELRTDSLLQRDYLGGSYE